MASLSFSLLKGLTVSYGLASGDLEERAPQVLFVIEDKNLVAIITVVLPLFLRVEEVVIPSRMGGVSPCHLLDQR